MSGPGSDGLDAHQLRAALGTFATGVCVITTTVGAEPRGFTANSFTSVSLDPPLVLVCLDKQASCYGAFAGADGFAVNILAQPQRAISGIFASKGEDKFGAVDHWAGPAGNPILSGCAAWLDCRMQRQVHAGDHLILIGKVLGCADNRRMPLGYLRGAYIDFALDQKAIAATGPRTVIGAIIEGEAGLLFLDRPDGGLALPSGAGLGSMRDEASLLGVLDRLGLECELESLFAVCEDSARGELEVYFRGRVASGEISSRTARFIAWDEIPWPRLRDDAIRSMMQRYLDERLHHGFGIYVGSAVSGRISRIVGDGTAAAGPGPYQRA